MLNKKAYLAENLLDKTKLEMAATRVGYGKGLVEAGEKDQRVVVLCADLTESTHSHWFKEKFPERFVELGVAEQNMATVAAGMANYGKIPFISSYAAFSPGRNWEQIRTTVALNNLPVKIGGAHAGISVGPDGATHQQLEDVALMRAMPNMIVLVPCDAVEAQKATTAVAFNGKPTYIRFGREKSPVFTTEKTPFEIGRAEIFREGKDVSIIGCGMLLYNALVVAEELAKEGIECAVINSHTVKPIDKDAIIEIAKKTGAVVSVEEHQINGGLGSAIAEVLARNYPVPQEFVGVQNRFGESGKPDELIEAFGMGVGSIKEAVKKVLKRKKMNFMKLVFSLLASFLFFGLAQADNQSCANIVNVYWEDSSGSRLSLDDKVTVGSQVKAVAKTDNAINGAKTADCQGVKVQFKLCNDGRNCTSANSAPLGEAVFDSTGKAAAAWTAAKVSGSNTNEFIFEASLPNGQKRTVPGRIVVVDAGEVKTCEILKVTGKLSGNVVTAAAETNQNCEGKDVVFRLCRQNNANPNASFTDCFQNLGTKKIADSKAEAGGTVAGESLGERSLSLFVSGRLSSGGQEKFSGLLSFNPDDFTVGAPSVSFNFKTDLFKFKIDNPLAGRAENIIDLLGIIANFIFQLGVPVAVIIIIYSGILFLVSRDKPAIVQKATNGLKYAAIGLAVLLIGKGFVSLIQSILSIR